MVPRVHSSSPTTPSSPTCTGERRKVFTVWMKSLVFNGHGCTVYDSDGGIVYRVDNYGSASCGGGGVCLMDLHGTVVVHIVKKRLTLGSTRWEGYRRWPGETPWFTVTRPCSPFRRSSSCDFWCDSTERVRRYTITDERRTITIVDPCTGLAVAEAKRKTTAGRVALGEDVLSLVVEPHTDPSLVMGLVLLHGLIM